MLQLIVWIACSLGLFAADILRNAGRLSAKEQDTGGTAEHTGSCESSPCSVCITLLPGTEAHQRRCLSAAGVAGTDSRDGCICYCVCLSLHEKREERELIHSWIF